MSRLIWRAANQLSSEYVRYRRYIDRYVRLSREDASREATRTLYQYLTYCRAYSTFWRDRWPKEGQEFSPEEANDVLALLPRLTKADLRDHLNEIWISPATRRPGDGFPTLGRQTRMDSGGSTGVPTTVYTDTFTSARERATRDFLYELCGLVPGDRFFFVWGSPNELLDAKSSLRKRLSSRLRGTVWIPAFSLTSEEIKAILQSINEQTSVRSAICFATALETILDFVQREGLKPRLLDRAFSGGGLLHSHLRQAALQHFAREIFDTYAGRDIGIVAHETPAHDGLSTVGWFSRVEVLDEAGRRAEPGQQGEVHVTQMNNYSCALIRLATGDTACWQPDPGAGPLPTSRLTGLAGRLADRLRGPNGVVLDPAAVIHLVGVVIRPAWLRKFQLVQHAADSYSLKVESWIDEVPQEELKEFERQFAAELCNLMRSKVEGRVVLVKEIPRLPSGKHLYCATELGQDPLGGR